MRPSTPSILLVVAALVVSAAGTRADTLEPGTRQPGRQPTGATEDSAATVLAVIGDYGGYNDGARNVADLVDSIDPDGIVTVGDNLYATPPGIEGTDMFDLTVGQHFCDFLAGAAPGPYCPTGGNSEANRFFAATGNHDYTDAGIDVYTDYFDLPGPGTSSLTEGVEDRYYDVLIDDVHLFVLDTDPALEDDEELERQREWLQEGLGNSPATWQVVSMHHPPYSSGTDGGPTPPFQWPFAVWGADLVLAGHEHSYERLERDGITYVVNGLGGASRYPFAEPVPGSVVRFNDDEAVVRLEVTPERMDVQLLTVSGALVDSTTIEPLAPPATASFQDGVAPSAAWAGTSDATVSEHEPTRRLGALPWLRADGDDPPESGSGLRSLLRWDVSALPPGSTALSAWMTLEVTNPAAEQSYEVYPVSGRWDERTVTWEESAAGTPWQRPGASGALDRAPVATLAPTEKGTWTVPLDLPAVELVQSWLDGEQAGGLLIAGPDSSDGIEAHSSEAEEAELRPHLEVAFRPPPGPWVDPASRRLVTNLQGSLDEFLQASGGTGSYRWELYGDVPAGVAVSEDGTLSVRDGEAGTLSFEVLVTDSEGVSSEPTGIEVEVRSDRTIDAGLGEGSGSAGNLRDLAAITAVGVVGIVVVALVWRRRRPE